MNLSIYPIESHNSELNKVKYYFSFRFNYLEGFRNPKLKY